MSDPLQPNDSADPKVTPGGVAEARPAEAGVANAPVAVEPTANAATLAAAAPPSAPTTPQPWLAGNGPVVVYILLVICTIAGLSALVAWGVRGGAKEFSTIAATLNQNQNRNGGSSGGAGDTDGRTVDSAAQEEAEALLARVAAGDAAAAQQVLAESDGWTGKTHRTARTNQSISGSLNLSNPELREAAVQAQLALDGVPRTEGGVAMLERTVGDPGQRAWALWMLGALANRGVDPAHTVKIVESYLDDPDVQVRASAVDALSLAGADETIPMLLDRFRNDPSPVVQERAMCDISQSGFYTHAQRMNAAATLVGWVDDSLLNAQQRAWVAQGLSDIAGKSFGTNSAAWKNWYSSAL